MSIAIGWADYGSVKSEFMFSVANTVLYDSQKRKLISNVVAATMAAVSRGKNAVMQEFLKTDAQWLLMMDADTIWHEDLIYRLYDIATQKNIDVLSGIYFLRPNGEKSKMVPAAYQIKDGKDIELDLFNNLDNDLVEISWAGGGALLLSRQAVILSKRINSNGIEYWFKEGINNDYCGEDYFLFNSLREEGYKIYCSPQVQIPHIKQVRLTINDYLEEQKDKKNLDNISAN